MANNKRKRRREPSKRGSIIALCIVLLLTIFVGYLGFNGLWLDSRGLWKLLPWLPTADTANWPKPLTLGLDLRGGVYIEYDATAPEGSESDFKTLMDGTVEIIQNRLTAAGYSEATVQTINNGTGIRAEIPSVSDPEAIVQLVGKTAVLSFRTADGTEFMTGKHVKRANYTYDSTEGKGYYISLELDNEGADLFAQATARAAASTGENKRIGIYLDNEMLMNPEAHEAIYGGNIAITGNFTQEEARNYAAQIQSGALPLNLKELNHSTVSATLGDNALSGAVTAAFIGILLIMGFMIFRYRLNGVVASWALCIYIIVLFFLLALFDGIQLTLPGLAGIVLGIGMAVDANVIIYERFNEELRSGSDVKRAAKSGFKNAMRAILDANVTTMIAGLVLLFFGTGPSQGFAKTLLLGVLVSMLTAVLVTRFLLTRFIGAGLNNPKLYCNVPAAPAEAEKEVQ